MPEVFLDQQVFVARVGHRSTRGQIDHMEEKMDRVDWDHIVDQKWWQIKQMLDRVHRQARPRADIHVAVVQRMDGHCQTKVSWRGQVVNLASRDGKILLISLFQNKPWSHLTYNMMRVTICLTAPVERLYLPPPCAVSKTTASLTTHETLWASRVII